MQTTTHGNGYRLDDLYILPDDHAEQERIVRYLMSREIMFRWQFSDVEGQDWHGKRFIEIPSGEGLESVIGAAASQPARGDQRPSLADSFTSNPH